MKFNEQTGERYQIISKSLIPRKLGIRTRLEFHRNLGKLLGFMPENLQYWLAKFY